ncbi:MAG: phosphate acyltransferase PlsX [Candidatus Latescibacteria bacterium]|nr:phosphate acyltransferase PlsX [Candidatus Latescibacterota bacterium]
MDGNATPRVVVAVDAMGGDFGPAAVVPGAVAAARAEPGLALALYGDPDALDVLLDGLDARELPVEVVACRDRIEMGESPAAAVKGRPDAPIVRATRDHREGRVHAVVSAGSTGAQVAASLMILGRLEGVDRPAIATGIPTLNGRFLMLDVGANVLNTPEHLLVFALLGDEYARRLMDVATPRVGLLNIGEEPTKGTELCIQAHTLLRDAPLNFIGNVESRHLLEGAADVVVTDGYTGNIALKLIEGFGGFLQAAAREFLAGGAAGAGEGLRGLLHRLDYTSTGGALLLGVRGSSIICHGASPARAIQSAVLAAGRMARLDLPGLLQQRLAART